MGLRRQARIIAFQTLYRYDFTKEPLSRLLNFSWLGEEKMENMKAEVKNFAQVLISGTMDKLQEIDKVIGEHLDNWSFSRLAKVDRANLRLGVYGLLFLEDVPANVTIDESVEIAREYGTDDSYRFINGVLDSVNKELKKK